MNKPLYSIAQEYLAAYHALNSDEELSEEIIRDTLSGIDSEFKTKAINTAAIIKNITADAQAIKNAEYNMQVRRNRLERRIEWLERNLLINMQGLGMDKIQHDEFDIKIKKNPAKVVVDEGVQLPEEFIRSKVVEEPDKTKIKAALKNDQVIKGVRLVQENKLIIE